MTTPSFAPRAAIVALYQGTDSEQIAVLREAAERAAKDESKAPRLMHEESSAEALAAKHDEFVAEAKGRAIMVELRALGRKQWRALVAANPPRDGNEDDQAVGVDEDKFSEALVPASIATPAFERDADRDAFLDSLSDAQFSKLYITAFALNRTVAADPKELLGSERSPSSSATEN